MEIFFVPKALFLLGEIGGQLSAQMGGKQYFTDVKRKEYQSTGGQSGKKARICRLCEPKSAAEIHYQSSKEYPEKLRNRTGKAADSTGGSPCEKKIADEIPAAGSGKAADTGKIARKNRQTDSPQKEINSDGGYGISGRQKICRQIDDEGCQRKGDTAEGERYADGGEDAQECGKKSNID